MESPCRHPALVALGFAMLVALGSAGCAGPTVWERAFEPCVGASLEPVAEGAPVRVREVPWDRIHETLRALEDDVAASDTPPDEWPPERRAQAQARLLRALQVTSDPATIEVLGVSEFRTTDPLRPGGTGGEDLRVFARRIGADEAVWSARYLGKAQRIVDRPVSAYTTGTDWFFGRRGRGGWGRHGNGFYSESTTTWVPVAVEADEHAYIAFFLRRR